MINETGTFYLEGEYQQGDTILSAGDWQLRADGSKNVFAYTPDTFTRRNLLNWSEDFSKVSASDLLDSLIGSNTTTAPDGSLTADKLIEGTNDSSHFLRYAVPQQIHTASIFVKAAERSKCRISLRTAFSIFSVVEIDLITGDILDSSNIFSVNSVGNGWYRVTVTHTAIPAANYLTAFSITVLNHDGEASYQGDGTSGIYIWGAQLELGSTPTPYQRTTTNVPRPYAIKDELVTNGDFSSEDVSDWTTTQSLSNFSVVDGEALVEVTDAGGVSLAISNLQIGATYEVSVDARLGTASSIGIRINALPNRNPNSVLDLNTTSTTTVTLNGTFTATHGVMYVYLRNASAGTSFWDNLSVKLLEPAPITLGNGNHKDFRYYPKALSANEVEALKA